MSHTVGCMLLLLAFILICLGTKGGFKQGVVALLLGLYLVSSH